jgi:hypothetical protein
MNIKANMPNLIIPGAGKSGTSSLHNYLNLHPDIYMSERKEPFFFSHDKNYYNKKEWYQNLFLLGNGKKYVGESSTSYFASKIAIERMKKDLEDPKFIILLRNPIDRILSQYLWLKSKGLEHRNLEAAIKYDANYEINTNYHIFSHGKCYLQYSLYYKWVKNYITTFGKENVLVITTENLKNDPLSTLNKCFDFLNVDKISKIESHKNENKTVHRKVPYWDALVLYILFTVNYKNLFFRIKEALVPDIVKSFYWRFHEYYTKNKILQEKPIVPNNIRLWLKSLLEEDVLELKDITSMQFSEWSDFQ